MFVLFFFLTRHALCNLEKQSTGIPALHAIEDVFIIIFFFFWKFTSRKLWKIMEI